jgi:hypothetical protein
LDYPKYLGPTVILAELFFAIIDSEIVLEIAQFAVRLPVIAQR